MLNNSIEASHHPQTQLTLPILPHDLPKINLAILGRRSEVQGGERVGGCGRKPINVR